MESHSAASKATGVTADLPLLLVGVWKSRPSRVVGLEVPPGPCKSPPGIRPSEPPMFGWYFLIIAFLRRRDPIVRVLWVSRRKAWETIQRS